MDRHPEPQSQASVLASESPVVLLQHLLKLVKQRVEQERRKFGRHAEDVAVPGSLREAARLPHLAKVASSKCAPEQVGNRVAEFRLSGAGIAGELLGVNREDR